MKIFPLVTFFSLALCALFIKADDVTIHINRALREQQDIAEMVEEINENAIQRRGQSNPEIEYAIQCALSATGIGLLGAWKRPENKIEYVKATALVLILLVGFRAAWNWFIDWCHSVGEHEQIRELIRQNTTRTEIIAYLQDSRDSTLDGALTSQRTRRSSDDTFSDK